MNCMSNKVRRSKAKVVAKRTKKPATAKNKKSMQFLVNTTVTLTAITGKAPKA